MVLGVTSNTINASITSSVIIGTQQYTANRSDTVFMQNTDTTGQAVVTGSVIGATSILEQDKTTPAFSSDKIELGSSTVPVQYGNCYYTR